MASLITKINLKSLQNINAKCSPFYQVVRYEFKRPNLRPKVGTIKHRNLIESNCQSLACKGFLRSQKPYTPPPDAEEKVDNICKDILGREFDLDASLSLNDKFYLLDACFKVIGHSVPNSLLCKITTPREIIEFYKTPVSTTTPYDDLRNRDDLPPNLYIQPDYVRYDPDTDPFPGNTTAFPHSSVLVTGLRSRKKYKSIYTKLPHEYQNEAQFIKEKVE